MTDKSDTTGPTLEEQIEWANSLVDDTRMPHRFRDMHNAILASLKELAALRAMQGAIEELVRAAEDVDVSSQGIRGQALFDALEKLNRSE